MSVKTTHKKYDKYAPKWQRARDVMAGQDQVHEGGTRYLPKLKDQTTEDYAAYVMRAPFYNASWRTVAGLLGLLFRKPPEIIVPTAIEPYLEDISMAGVPFSMFAEQVALEDLTIGFYGILVDHPPAPEVAPGEALTVAKAEAMGLRPAMQLYLAECILNWRFRQVNNKHTLCMVVLAEECCEPKNEFEDSVKTQYRVLDLDEAGFYRVRVFEVDKDGKDVLVKGPIYPLQNNKPMTEIPFEADFEFGEPPLIDLIDMNLSHYRTSADYEHGCHFTGLPTPVVSGYTAPIQANGQPPPKLFIGSSSAWLLPDPQASASFLEFTGQGLTALKDNLERKETIMSVLGAKMLATEKAGVEAFKTMATRSAGETSILSAISINVSLRVERSLTTFSAWGGGVDSEVEFELNRDFLPVAMDAPTLQAYMQAWQTGAISKQDLFALFKRGDLIEAEKSFEDQQAEIDSEPPPVPPGAPKPVDPTKKPPVDD